MATSAACRSSSTITIGRRAAAARMNEAVASNAPKRAASVSSDGAGSALVRKPLTQLGRDLRDVGRAGTEVLGHLLGRPVAQELADHLGPGPVGGRAAGVPGAAPEHGVAVLGGLVGHRLGQARLADAGLASEEDQGAASRLSTGQCR